MKLLVSFTVEKSKDEVVDDVVLIHATHLLLGHFDSLIGKPSMMGSKLGIPWRKMERFTH